MESTSPSARDRVSKRSSNAYAPLRPILIARAVPNLPCKGLLYLDVRGVVGKR